MYKVTAVKLEAEGVSISPDFSDWTGPRCWKALGRGVEEGGGGVPKGGEKRGVYKA